MSEIDHFCFWTLRQQSNLRRSCIIAAQTKIRRRSHSIAAALTTDAAEATVMAERRAKDRAKRTVVLGKLNKLVAQ